MTEVEKFGILTDVKKFQISPRSLAFEVIWIFLAGQEGERIGGRIGGRIEGRIEGRTKAFQADPKWNSGIYLKKSEILVPPFPVL